MPFLCIVEEEILHNWEQKSASAKKAYKRMLEKGNKNVLLKQLPDLHEKAFEQVDCLSCARCCKHYSPRFKTPDIRRISRYLDLRESEFIDQYLKLDEEGDYVLKQSPCSFLGEDNRCRIYEVRPSDCSRFPYTDEDVLIKRTNLTITNAGFCPITYYVLESLRILTEQTGQGK